MEPKDSRHVSVARSSQVTFGDRTRPKTTRFLPPGNGADRNHVCPEQTCGLRQGRPEARGRRGWMAAGINVEWTRSTPYQALSQTSRASLKKTKTKTGDLWEAVPAVIFTNENVKGFSVTMRLAD